MQTVRQLVFDHVPAVFADFLGQVKKILFRGSAYQCPLCLSDPRSLLPLPRQFGVTLEIKGRRFTPWIT